MSKKKELAKEAVWTTTGETVDVIERTGTKVTIMVGGKDTHIVEEADLQYIYPSNGGGRKAAKPPKAAKEPKPPREKKVKEPKPPRQRINPEDSKNIFKGTAEHFIKREVKTAKGNAVFDCGDQVAGLLAGKSLDEVFQLVAHEADIAVTDLESKYAHLNNGQKRMNLGNRLRGVFTARAKAAQAAEAEAKAA